MNDALKKGQLRRKYITRATKKPHIFQLRQSGIYWILEENERYSDTTIGYYIPDCVAKQLIKQTSIKILFS